MSDTTENDQEQAVGEGQEQGVMDDWADALEEAGAGDSGDSEVNPAGLQNLQDDSTPGNEDINLDVILDVPVTVSMEIGQTKISIRNLLQLNQGSVVELDRLAGEPLDVLVNGTLIAHGEVVVVNEKFGIRLTDVISPVERVKKLK
ncbi:MAG: flagellar motor switch protein FliN [Gammaproteobacteria bacterium]|nr:flagellar motor switch protein FliN [Gammaproteobacteria bacterium]